MSEGPRSWLDLEPLEEPEKETLWPVPVGPSDNFGRDHKRLFSGLRAGPRGEIIDVTMRKMRSNTECS